MDMRKLRVTSHPITTLIVAVALALPCGTGAVGIGKVVVQSVRGEPLLAQVELIAGSEERIEGSCLSLVAPDPLHEDVGRFLTEADLSIQSDGNRQYVNISSRKTFVDSFSQLRLQVRCPGMSGVIKTLDISSSAQKYTGKTPHPSSAAHDLSGDPGNVSRIGKISSEEIALLLVQQKLLVDGFLTMQYQLKQLQDELAEIKSQLAQSSVSSAVVASAAIQTTGILDRLQGSPYLYDAIWVVLGLALIVFSWWLGSRLYIQIKSHIETGARNVSAPALKRSADVATTKALLPYGIKQPSHVTSVSAPAIVPQPKGSTGGSVLPVAAHPVPPKAGEKVTEMDLMLEEAQLYAANGRLAKAVEILQEIIKQSPSKADAWTLLLSLYSSLGNVSEFESTAREFLKYHKDSPLWGGLQVLGRTLDRDNPLYADSGGRIAAAPLLSDTADLRHPIGDVLIEMGVLSKREIQIYLGDFDPKKHGRFGGYLVARKAITLAQLDQALLQQQGVNVEAQPGALPSLQDIENFLASFDPKQHGSVGKFMAAHNVVTPEQLSQVLKRQSSGGAAVTTQATPSASHNSVSAS